VTYSWKIFLGNRRRRQRKNNSWNSNWTT